MVERKSKAWAAYRSLRSVWKSNFRKDVTICLFVFAAKSAIVRVWDFDTDQEIHRAWVAQENAENDFEY